MKPVLGVNATHSWTRTSSPRDRAARFRARRRWALAAASAPLALALVACGGAPDGGDGAEQAQSSGVTVHGGGGGGGGKTNGSGSFYTTYSPSGAATPSSVMLDLLGKVSMTIKNQGTNGGCWGFSDVAVIESEYISEYGYPAATFALSDQYNIFDAVKGYWGESDQYSPGSSTSGGIGSFEMISHYGLPPLASYPVNLGGPWNAIPRVLGAAYAAANPLSFPSALSTYAQTGAADPNWLTALGNYANQTPLAQDLVRFNSATLAPQSVQEQALYAPMAAEWVNFSTKYKPGRANGCLDPNASGDTSINCANVFPFEEVLNQGHTIKLTMNSDPNDWLQDPTTKVFSYNKNGAFDGHEVALVGYDRQKQVFKFKNSWGPTWNGTGFGEMSYYTLLKVSNAVNSAAFVTSVRNPSPGTLGGGAWMGFWNARIKGQSGVAALHYTFPYSIAINSGAIPLVDVFQNSATGQTLQIPPISGTASSSKIVFSGSPSTSAKYPLSDPFTLSRNAGAVTATFTDAATGETETWYKCDPTGSTFNTGPVKYSAAGSDPYVLPPCGGSAWEETPAATCKPGDVPVPSGIVQYHTASSYPAPVQASVCIGLSSAVPQCPAGQTLNLDTGEAYYGSTANGDLPYRDICTLTGQSTTYSDSTIPSTCESTPIPVLGTTGFLDTVSDSSNALVAGAETMFQPGTDECVSSVYGVFFQCPEGSTMEPNGDCLVQAPHVTGVFWNQDYGYPAVSPPALGDWSPGNYKGQCALGSPIIGVSRAINALESHAVECGAPTLSTGPSGGQCYMRQAYPYDNRGTTDSGQDWDPGAYKTECAANEYVAGISQAANGVLESVLCCAATVAHASCDAQVFYNNDSPAYGGPDWDPGYYKGQCPDGQYVAGISTPAYSAVGTGGAAHAVLCCSP